MSTDVVLQQQAYNHRLTPWLRVTLWAMAHADDRGHAPAYPGELRTVLGDVSAHEVSRAIRLAKARHLLDDASHAGCLVLVGYAGHPCHAHHREVG